MTDQPRNISHGRATTLSLKRQTLLSAALIVVALTLSGCNYILSNLADSNLLAIYNESDSKIDADLLVPQQDYDSGPESERDWGKPEITVPAGELGLLESELLDNLPASSSQIVHFRIRFANLNSTVVASTEFSEMYADHYSITVFQDRVYLGRPDDLGREITAPD